MNEKEIYFVENIDLVKSDLTHLNFELERKATNYFRIAVEAHSCLLRAMVQVLKGPTNFNIILLKQDQHKNMTYTFHINSNKPVYLEENIVPGCKKAWRFRTKELKDTSLSSKHNPKRWHEHYENEYLKNFFELLAMLQSDYFMKFYTQANTLSISDEDMKTLEWLHFEIRNAIEHFIPKDYGAPIYDLLKGSLICLGLSSQCLVDSGSLCATYDENEIKNLMSPAIEKIKELLKHAS